MAAVLMRDSGPYALKVCGAKVPCKTCASVLTAFQTAYQEAYHESLTFPGDVGAHKNQTVIDFPSWMTELGLTASLPKFEKFLRIFESMPKQ